MRGGKYKKKMPILGKISFQKFKDFTNVDANKGAIKG